MAPLPIPATLEPDFTAVTPDVNFPDVLGSDLFSLADNTTAYFGLRFTGASLARPPFQT